MTTLVLAQRKIFLQYLPYCFQQIRDWFSLINRRQYVSLILLSTLVIFAASYVMSLFLMFDLGYKIREGNKGLIKIRSDVVRGEFGLREGQMKFAQNLKTALGLMEGASDIRYISIENVVVSRPLLSP